MNTRFSTPTDRRHTMTVESRILHARWLTPVARGGSTAPLEVRTALVGEGAVVHIIGRTDTGKKFGKVKGRIYRNRFQSAIGIPANLTLDDHVCFEVKLPKHGLALESNRVPVCPDIVITGMAWDRETARRDEEVRAWVTFESGVAEGACAAITILEFDRDGCHDEIVTIPATITNGRIDISWRFEYHDDTDDIPSAGEMREYGKDYHPPEYFFVVEVDGQRVGEKQESGLLRFRDEVSLWYTTFQGKPMSHAAYTLFLPDGSERTGTLDADGCAREGDIPPGHVDVEYEIAEE